MSQPHSIVRIVHNMAVRFCGIRYNVDHIPEALEGVRLTLTPTESGYSARTPDNKQYELTEAHLRKSIPLQCAVPVVVTTRTIRQGGFTFCGGEYQIPRRLEGEQIKTVQQGSKLVGVYLNQPSQTGEKARYRFIPGGQLPQPTYTEFSFECC